MRLLPASLLQRFQVLKVPAPRPEHYPVIVHGVLDDIARAHGVPRVYLPVLGEADWRWLEGYYSSPRVLRRALEHLIELRAAVPCEGVRH